jgi:hypothetical protein
MRLLLINPRFPESFWSSKCALAEVLPNKRTMNPPLGLATLAALCPPHWEVEIVDENIEPIPLEPQAGIVGVCGMGVAVPTSAGVARLLPQPRLERPRSAWRAGACARGKSQPVRCSAHSENPTSSLVLVAKIVKRCSAKI